MRRAILISIWGAALAIVPATGASAAQDFVTRVSAPSPFAPDCSGPGGDAASTRNSEVEPWVATNPEHERNLIGVWQQDRWLFGGANGLLTAVSNDGGKTWEHPTPPPFARCQGGDSQNGGDYDLATDPWVTIGPDGDAYQASLSFSGIFGASAVLVSRSRDDGRTWGPITTLIRDEGPGFSNDKESITADPKDGRFVYAVWNRFEALDPANPILGPFLGPTYFARTSDGGETWEPARNIFDPGLNNQTLGNQIVVQPDGGLVNAFDLILADKHQVAVIRSADKGATWSDQAIVVDDNTPAAVRDPVDGALVRSEAPLPEIAIDPRPRSGAVYIVWEDAQFTSGERNQVAFSKSSDGGETWSPAKRISENPATQAFLPSIEVNDEGEIAVTYYDFTHDTAASSSLDTDYWIAFSRDGGETFGTRERLTQTSFDMKAAPLTLAGVQFGRFLGDYEGLASAGRTFKPFFALANNGDVSNPSDVFATSVRPPPVPCGRRITAGARFDDDLENCRRQRDRDRGKHRPRKRDRDGGRR